MVTRAGSRRVVIVGTGTGVGKTHLGVTLAHVLALEGERVAALKPIESGVASAGALVGCLSDTEQLAAASSVRPQLPPPYAFPEPISPHLAARRAGVTIDLATVVDWIAGCSCHWVLVETAGGLLSPLGFGITNLDLARALRPDAVILVAQDRLGVLHEVAACGLALRVLAGELREWVVALQAPEVADLSTGTNAGELVSLGLTERVVAFPRGAPTDGAVRMAGKRLREILRELG